MKRYIAALLAVLTLAGCGASTTADPASSKPEATGSVAATSSPTPSPSCGLDGNMCNSGFSSSSTSTSSAPAPRPTRRTPAKKFAQAVENASSSYVTWEGTGAWPSVASLARSGRAVCKALEQGLTPGQVVTTLEGTSGFSDLGVPAEQFMAIAQVNLCPSTL